MLITTDSLIFDCESVPASAGDLVIGRELLQEYSKGIGVGDKDFVIATLADELWHNNRIPLLTKPRNNQMKQVSASAR